MDRRSLRAEHGVGLQNGERTLTTGPSIPTPRDRPRTVEARTQLSNRNLYEKVPSRPRGKQPN